MQKRGHKKMEKTIFVPSIVLVVAIIALSALALSTVHQDDSTNSTDTPDDSLYNSQCADEAQKITQLEKQIAEIRHNAGITQEDLARQLRNKQQDLAQERAARSALETEVARLRGETVVDTRPEDYISPLDPNFKIGDIRLKYCDKLKIEMRDFIDEIEDDIRDVEDDIDDFQDDVDDARADLDRAEAEGNPRYIDDAEDDLDDAEDDLDAAEDFLDDLEDELEDYIDLIQYIDKQCDFLRRDARFFPRS